MKNGNITLASGVLISIILMISPVSTSELRESHRVLLAQDLLEEQGSGLNEAWPGGRTRLSVANELYCELIELPKSLPGTIAAHLNSPLLGMLLTESMYHLNTDVSTNHDTVIASVKQLSAHLKLCVKSGGNLKNNTHILKFNTWLADDLLKKLREISSIPLPTFADVNASLPPDTIRAIERFVDRLVLALELREILPKTEPGLPDYLKAAIKGLRENVFDLEKARNRDLNEPAKTLFWDQRLVRFRAKIFQALSKPLHDCLEDSQDLEKALFQEIVLALPAVHGFLKVSQQAYGLKWAFAPWLGSNDERYKQMFQAVNTDRWLDADPALLQLTQEHLKLLGGDLNLWAAEPELIFGGNFNKNANLRVWKMLLSTEEPPDDRAQWKLMRISQKACKLLQNGMPPHSPTFPIQDDVPSSEELCDEEWAYADWIESIVSGAEWVEYPLLLEASRAPDAPDYGVSFSANYNIPFIVSVPEITEEDRRKYTRKVDGNARLILTKVLNDAVDNIDELCRAAEVALFLPNAKENNFGENVTVKNADRLKDDLIKRMLDEFSNLLCSDEIVRKSIKRLFRTIMLLDVSRRNVKLCLPFSGGQQNSVCDFTRACDMVKSWIEGKKGGSSNAESTAAAAGWLENLMRSLQNQHFDIVMSLKEQEGENERSATHRSKLDERLKILLPPEYTPGYAIQTSNFTQARIEQLDIDNVEFLLAVRDDLETIVGEYAPVKDAANAAGDAIGMQSGFSKEDMRDDVERIIKVLDLFDYALWFSRGDLDINIYTKNRLGAPGNYWYPSFLALAWYDAALQEGTFQALEAIEVKAHGTSADSHPGKSEDDIENEILELVDICYWRMYQLNEVIFLSVMDAANREGGEAAGMLEFIKIIQKDIYDFKLLFKRAKEQPLTPEKLCESALAAVSSNLRILQIRIQSHPNDAGAYDRIFGVNNSQLPLVYRRSEEFLKTFPIVNVDFAVKKALKWSQSDIEALKLGAMNFLRMDNMRLLDGTRTPAGIMRIITQINQRAQSSKSARYGEFYDDQFTEGAYFNEHFLSSFSKVFFNVYHDLEKEGEENCEPVPVAGDGELTQRGRTRALLLEWVEASILNDVDTKLNTVYRERFVQVISDLMKGERVPEGCGYIWEAADRLKAGEVKKEGQWVKKSILSEEPSDFLDLMLWIDNLENELILRKREVLAGIRKHD